MENFKEIDEFQISKAMSGEEIVISGISGVFPNSDSVLEFSKNLYNKVDMVSEEPRWTTEDHEIPKHVGKISKIDKFDAQFFKVGYHQGKVLEPVSRKIFEHAFGAIFDSGNSQASLKGMKIGVFIGVSFADYATLSFYDKEIHSNFMVGGFSKSMIANRISYWVDGSGPSYCLDFSCASSAAALQKAFQSIKSAECDAAVVGSGNHCSHPMLSLNLKKAGFLCSNGKTRCFDKNSDGYVRAEAISLLFLQKSKDAKRIYAEVYHTDGKYQLKPDAPFLAIQQTENLQKYLNDFYSEINIEPDIVEYVEANGTATVTADENELDAIGQVFAKNKSVNIGCVKSNMGHSEAVSGLTAVTKLCLAYHKGKLPANLHYEEPLDIPAVQNGKVQVLTETTHFDRGFTAINNFSFTGANYHVVLKGHYKEKNLSKYYSELPRLVLASGRQEFSVNKILDSLKSKPFDAEEIALLHNIFKDDIVGHTGRGYSILGTNKDNEVKNASQSVQYYSGVKPPLWFVFSGMGSQWTGMGADLMKIPTFRKSIERCHKVLASRGVDIIKIISEPDKTIFDNILNAFVGIGAVQIGLTDILKEIRVEPDYIIGHSLGEMACAYHDNTFTTEELILSTYSRGQAVMESQLIKGSMAAVGIGYKDLIGCCPPNIDIACHNSSESSTISGPSDAMKEFVTDLTKRGIFAKEVPSADVAYHSRYMANAGPALLRRLREVIKDPKLRSKKWISTSVPQEHWDSHNAKYSSPEYHTNNMLSPVLFEEMLSLIPSNAVVVEVAPHGLLQAILKRSHPQCTHIPLTRRGCTDGVTFLLEGIGKLYQAGYNPKVDILYPKVEFPVSTETPLLSHLVEWEHSETWPLLKLDSAEKDVTSSRDLIISVHDGDYSYIANNIINGVSKIPEAALLVYVWETLALNKQVDFRSLSVVFRDVQFHSDVIVQPETNVILSIMISKGNDKFEIIQEDTPVVTGIVSEVKTMKLQLSAKYSNDDFDDVCFNSNEIYKVLSARGLSYDGVLKSIQSINFNQNSALVKWTDNWVPFLDSLIQFNIFMGNFNGTPQPKFVKKIKINVIEQELYAQKARKYIENEVTYSAQSDKILGITRCAGVEIEDITFIEHRNVGKGRNIIREKQFFPYFATELIDIKTALDVIMQIVAENANSKEIHIIKSITTKEPEVFKHFGTIADQLPEVTISIKSANTTTENEHCRPSTNIINVFVYENVFNDAKMLINVKNIEDNDFILTMENQIPRKETDIKNKFNVLSCMSDGKQILLLLLKKLKPNKDSHYLPITIENQYLWISQVKNELVTSKKVVIVSDKQPYSGLLGFVKTMKTDGYNNISLLAIHDIHAQKFDNTNEFYKNQLDKNLIVNVLKKGQWGGYYYSECAKTINLRNFTLKNNVPGNLDELNWVEASPCSKQKLLVQVSFSGLSLNDCYNAGDKINENNNFGMDFSGIDKNGDRVMGVLPGGTASSSVEADPDLYWPVPDHWTLEDAATVPLPYIHAYYCLMIKGKLKKGESVLMIGGAGALGQAVISLCLALGCTVFVTVSTIYKKTMLLKLFPQLQESNIAYSDCNSVHTMIMNNTNNKRCNLVINTATGSLRKAAMKCVGFTGSFLDLSKHEMRQNMNIGMSYLELDRSYRAVDLSNIFKPEYVNDKRFLHQCLSEGISSGAVTPLTRAVYPPGAVTRACRLLAARRHVGRVLLKLRSPTILSEGLTVSPRLTYSPEDVVLIVCDESDLGVLLADLLIQRGVKKIFLQIKPDNISGFVQAMIISWSKREVSVKLSSENIRSEQGCANLMKNAMKFGKVKAVFIALDGNGSDDGEKNDFIDAYNEKFSVVLNIDMATRNYAEIRHFTIVANINNNARDEYVFAMTERACELRTELGFPALVVRCSENIELSEHQYFKQKIDSPLLLTILDTIEISLKMKYKNVVSFNLKENNTNFSDKVAEIMGVKTIESLNNSSTLFDLNVNEIALNELRTIIRSSFQIDYTLEKISSMTVKSLKDMSERKKVQTTDFSCGLSAFYKEIDSEEEHLSEDLLTTMPSNSRCKSDKSHLDSEHLIMIPGFDNRCAFFKTIAKKLKIAATAVSITEGQSIQEKAQHIRKLLQHKLGTKSKFYILGYSFGAHIGLELAAVLEKEGKKGVVFCLDSSPDSLRSHLEAYIGKLSDDEMQNETLIHIFYLLAGYKNEEIIQELNKLHSFEEKVEVILKKLKGTVSYSEQYKRHVLKSLYERISLAKEYKPEMKLDSELILLKGIAHPASENLTEDYNLSQYTKKPVKVFQLNSDHALCHQDVRIANIINGQVF